LKIIRATVGMEIPASSLKKPPVMLGEACACNLVRRMKRATAAAFPKETRRPWRDGVKRFENLVR